MLKDKSIEDALDFVRDNAENIGILRGRKAGLDHKIKVFRAQTFLRADGTVGEREARGWTSREVVQAIADLQDTVTELTTMETLFKAAELRIEVWRTQNANMRRGNI